MNMRLRVLIGNCPKGFANIQLETDEKEKIRVCCTIYICSLGVGMYRTGGMYRLCLGPAGNNFSDVIDVGLVKRRLCFI